MCGVVSCGVVGKRFSRLIKSSFSFTFSIPILFMVCMYLFIFTYIYSIYRRPGFKCWPWKH